MPQTNYWRTDRPGEGLTANQFLSDPVVPVRTYLPDSYEPNYPYPLLVLFHGRGGNEDTAIRLAPRFSTQNFVAISLRGPELLGRRANGKPSCGWDNTPISELLDDYVRLAVELTRSTYHVHSERVYLAGVGDGAAAAFRAAFALGDKVAGVVALNGGLPRVVGEPVFRLPVARHLRVFLAHGQDNAAYRRAAADRDYKALYAAGADVNYRSYPTAKTLHADMMRDVNRWVIGNVNAEAEMFIEK